MRLVQGKLALGGWMDRWSAGILWIMDKAGGALVQLDRAVMAISPKERARAALGLFRFGAGEFGAK